MRENKREEVLDKIVALIDRDGLAGITFNAIASETGLTRGGLLYHFPSRDALVLAIHQHVAASWEEQLQNAVGKPADQATANERLAAYVKVSVTPARRAEMLLLLESKSTDVLSEVWVDAYGRWVPPIPDPDDQKSMIAFIARLAADGLWAYEALLSRPLSPEIRARVNAAIVALLEERP